MGETRTCESCGARFTVSDRELQQCRMPAPGKHHPSQCPEGLDTMCPNCDPNTCGPTECKQCRPKQDMQRS
jgi:hypothetical protein